MIAGYSPIVQSLLGSLFTWLVTAVGAALVFLFDRENLLLLDASLGFAAGVMTAASFWSLLSPALEISRIDYGSLAFIPVAGGFIFGALFVYVSEYVLTEFGFVGFTVSGQISTDASYCHVKAMHSDVDNNDNMIPNQNLTPLHSNHAISDSLRNRKPTVLSRSERAYDCHVTNTNCSSHLTHNEQTNLCHSHSNGEIETRLINRGTPNSANRTTTWKRVFLLILAVTVHNIPEGLAVGVGFGAAGKTPSATFQNARNLALGIGIQNFPEGFAVSLPLIGLGYSKWTSFWYGQLSGAVEPLAALLGTLAVRQAEPLLPYALSFAAGAMIFVVLDDIIPESQRNSNGKVASWMAVLGFVVMMSLDVGLG